jgi:hypothetical protein
MKNDGAAPTGSEHGVGIMGEAKANRVNYDGTNRHDRADSAE